MSFEVFDASRRSRRRGRMALTTSPKHRVMRLSAALHRALGDATHVHLLFDRDSGRIGVAAAPARSASAVRVGAKSHAVGCAAFLAAIGETGDDRTWPVVADGDRWVSVPE